MKEPLQSNLGSDLAHRVCFYQRAPPPHIRILFPPSLQRLLFSDAPARALSTYSGSDDSSEMQPSEMLL